MRGGPPGDLYIFVHLDAARDLPARGHHPVRALPGQLHHRGARRRRSRCPASTGRSTRSRSRPASSRASSCASAAPACRCCNGRGHGDMVIQIEVETPTKLSAQAARAARGVPRDRDRRGMPELEGLLRRSSRPCSAAEAASSLCRQPCPGGEGFANVSSEIDVTRRAGNPCFKEGDYKFQLE